MIITKSLTLIILLALLADQAWAAPSSLRKQWGRSAGSTARVPDRVIIIRVCGQPEDMIHPIGGIACSTELENVALACLDTHAEYHCRSTVWALLGH
jgi:mRNA-degrading endonuclease HigB of HigAB toxin-antitoxin module